MERRLTYHKYFWFENPPDKSITLPSDDDDNELITNLKQLYFGIVLNFTHSLQHDKVLSKYIKTNVFYMNEIEKNILINRLKEFYNIEVKSDVCNIEICFEKNFNFEKNFIFVCFEEDYDISIQVNQASISDIFNFWIKAQYYYSLKHHCSNKRIKYRLFSGFDENLNFRLYFIHSFYIFYMLKSP